MKHEYVHQSISAAVVFPKALPPNALQDSRQKSSTMPHIRSFKWENKVYRVMSNNLVHQVQKGSENVFMFSVTTVEGSFKLRFNSGTLKWYLEEVVWD